MNDRYFGGKGNVYQHIINRIPPHTVYIEPFLGGGSVMRKLKPVILNVGIDMDGDALEGFKKRDWPDASIAPTALMMGSGLILPLITGRVLLHGDGIAWLKHNKPYLDHMGRRAVLYLDPPYVHSTRGKHRYEHELTDDQHEDLLLFVANLDCSVLISGYPSDLYDRLLPGWHTHTYKAVTSGTATNGKMATERLWMNFPPPAELHDYRYLGDDYREREVVARRIKRQVKKFHRWSAIEWNALKAELIKEGLL